MELRDARTAPPAFRRAANRISVLLAAEALRELPSSAATVVTPLGPADGRVVLTDVVVVPVLRAGLGMLDAVLELLPTARVGHIGLQRDEATAIASRYYSKLPPDLSNSHVLMIDPMLEQSMLEGLRPSEQGTQIRGHLTCGHLDSRCVFGGPKR